MDKTGVNLINIQSCILFQIRNLHIPHYKRVDGKRERSSSQYTPQSSAMGINHQHTTQTNICFGTTHKEFNFFEGGGGGTPLSKNIMLTFVL